MDMFKFIIVVQIRVLFARFIYAYNRKCRYNGFKKTLLA